MAKRSTETAEGQEQEAPGSLEAAALGFAEDLGKLLGTAEKKANEWLSQRQAVTKQLTELRDKANQLLERLGEAGREGVRRGRRPGRPPGTAKASTDTGAGGTRSRKRRKPMSAAARKAVGERMKKYWAARKRAEKSA